MYADCVRGPTQEAAGFLQKQSDGRESCPRIFPAVSGQGGKRGAEKPRPRSSDRGAQGRLGNVYLHRQHLTQASLGLYLSPRCRELTPLLAALSMCEEQSIWGELG